MKTIVIAAALAEPTSWESSVAGPRRVLDALETLPPAQRAALVLVDMEGYPVHQVAQMLGCAEGTVKSRCFRGRARLAALLGDLDPTAAEPAEGNRADGGPVPTGDQPRGPPVAG